MVFGKVIVDVKGHEEGSGRVEVGLNSTKLVALTPHNHSQLVPLS